MYLWGPPKAVESPDFNLPSMRLLLISTPDNQPSLVHCGITSASLLSLAAFTPLSVRRYNYRCRAGLTVSTVKEIYEVALNSHALRWMPVYFTSYSLTLLCLDSDMSRRGARDPTATRSGPSGGNLQPPRQPRSVPDEAGPRSSPVSAEQSRLAPLQPTPTSRLQLDPFHADPETPSTPARAVSAAEGTARAQLPADADNSGERFLDLVRPLIEERLEASITRLTAILAASAPRTDHIDAIPAAPRARRSLDPTDFRRHVAAAASEGSPDHGSDGSDTGFSLSDQAPPRTGHASEGRRRTSIERLVEPAGGSELSALWSTGGHLAQPGTVSTVKWPNSEGKWMLLKPTGGRRVTARIFLDFFKTHFIMLNQVHYPLTFFVDEEMQAHIEMYYTEENLGYLPDDIQALGVVAFAHLSNRALVYVAQLCIRPTSRDKYLEALWSCSRPPKPTAGDSFIEQGVHYNYNMGLLNAIHENLDYLNLNGGIKHMPPLSWKQDPDRLGPSGKKRALGLIRVISEMLSGVLASQLVMHYRARTPEEESDASLALAPNFGKPREPKTVPEMMSQLRAIYRYYFTSAESIKRIKDNYEGHTSSTATDYEQARDRARDRARDQSREQPRDYGREDGRDPHAVLAKHPALRVLESATVTGNEQLLNVVHAFASDASELLQSVPDEQLDAAVDSAYSEHLEFLQAMSNMGVCFSAMLSPTGKCTKPKCPHRHDEESFKYGVVEQIVKYMNTGGYKDAVTAGLIKPIELKPDWDRAAPPPSARATVPQYGASRPVPPHRAGVPGPLVPPQTARYGTRHDPKLHVTAQVRPDDWEQPDEEGQTVVPPIPELLPLSAQEMDLRRRATTVFQQTSAMQTPDGAPPLPSRPLPRQPTILSRATTQPPASTEESSLPHEVLENGSRLYQLSTSVVAGMPTIPIQLSCGVDLEALPVDVDAPLDTGATMCYLSQALYEELAPHLDPRSVKNIRSRVRMGAPPDHQSDTQVDLKVQWEHAGEPHAAILRFVVLRTDNLRIILGLNAILLAGLLDPLVASLRDMSAQARQASSMFCMEVQDEEEVPTYYSLHVTHATEESPTSDDSSLPPFPGGGTPPTSVPSRSQVVHPARFHLADTFHGNRHLDLCPLFGLPQRELSSWPEAQVDHDIAIQRFLRDDQLSYVPRFRPFYWMDLQQVLHHEAEPLPHASLTTMEGTRDGTTCPSGNGASSRARAIPSVSLPTTPTKMSRVSSIHSVLHPTSTRSMRVGTGPAAHQ